VKLILTPSDPNFRANVIELHDARGASEPTRYEIVLRDGAVETRGIRLAQDSLMALSADGLHEAQFPLESIMSVVVHYLPKSLLCIIAPSRSNGTTSCAILGIHPTQEAAEWHALDYLTERGFAAKNYSELLQAVRQHADFDLVIEDI
jgi:hypothetical protein